MLGSLNSIAYGFVSSSESALMRNTLHEWHLSTTRKQARANNVMAAVAHAWMSLVTYIIETWKQNLREAKAERRAMGHGARMWHSTSLGKAWNTWQE